MKIILEDQREYKKVNGRNRRNVRFGIGFGMLGALFFVLFMQWWIPSPQLATVNIQNIIQQFIQTQAHSSLSASQFKKAMTFFCNSLASTLQRIAHQDHVILLPQAAVLAGGADFTPIVMNDLRKKDPYFFELPRHHSLMC